MIDVDQLAEEIRRVDGNHTLGAGALAEALLPFIHKCQEKVLAEQSLSTNKAVCDLHNALCRVSDHYNLTQPAISVIREHHKVINQAEAAMKQASAPGADKIGQGEGFQP